MHVLKTQFLHYVLLSTYTTYVACSENYQFRKIRQKKMAAQLNNEFRRLAVCSVLRLHKRIKLVSYNGEGGRANANLGKPSSVPTQDDSGQEISLPFPHLQHAFQVCLESL